LLKFKILDSAFLKLLVDMLKKLKIVKHYLFKPYAISPMHVLFLY